MSNTGQDMSIEIWQIKCHTILTCWNSSPKYMLEDLLEGMSQDMSENISKHISKHM
jgi:hypothetical protein